MVDMNDDDGRRYGDWQKKDLRKDANDIYRDPQEKPWYEQNFWMVILILVFWPVGLFLCWKGDWPLVAKIVATVFVALCVVGMVMIYNQKVLS